MNIPEIWKRHEELVTKETVLLACSSGCNTCCYQLVPVIWSEWEYIEAYLKEKNLKGVIYNREKKVIQKWTRYKTDNKTWLTKDPAKPFHDWRGKKCIFLNHFGKCDIYPVRPMNCRTVSSTAKCKSLMQPEARRFRFPYEKELTEELWKMAPSMAIPDLFMGLKFEK